MKKVLISFSLVASLVILCFMLVSPTHAVCPYPVCGDAVCDSLCGETGVSCAIDCVVTYTVTGNVYIDANNNGVKDGGELNYSGATVALTGNGTQNTNALGNYTFNSIGAGNFNVTLTVPVGYSATTVNPRAITLGPSATVNFGIRLIPPPACVPGTISQNPPGNVSPGSSVTISVTSCTNVEDPDNGVPPPPFTWNPDTSGNNPPPTISGQTDTPTSSTTSWTAPACPAVQTIYTPRVTVAGSGGTTNYSTSITVPATYTINVLIRDVDSLGACTAGSGNPYTGSSVNINTSGGSLPIGGTTQSTSTGSTSFTCLPSANYQTTIALPSGYSMIGTNGGTSSSGNTISSTPLSSNPTLVFCIAPLNPWYQTSVGDVRFIGLLNPVPTGLYGSTDPNYPGIFYSSDSSNAAFGNGSSSTKGWFVNGEYDYNSDTENRNGGMSYDFYKSKTKQDGVTVTPISSGTFDQTQITASGVYESPSDLTINLYTHVNGRRVVILVNGNVTINASTISIAQNQGIFIVAAKGNITIAKTIGTATLSSTTSNIDGYYTAQGSIILDGDSCPDTVTSDLRLNVGGALVANSLKPFSTSGTGTLQNRRSLCFNNLLYPSLYISARPDFITQLTDFYKTTYTKWQEVSP